MSSLRRFSGRLLTIQSNYQTINKINKNLSNFRNVKKEANSVNKYLVIIGGGVAAFTCAKLLKFHTHTVHASNLKRMRDEENTVKLTARERRFIKFSSVEYEGQLYMTPQDFLDSVVEQEPRPRLKRRQLTINDINKIKDSTPALKKGSVKLFRTLRERGIISYTEYLFLLSILTKPKSGFHIAFNMFDTDGNQRVDKEEFLVIQKILGGSFSNHEVDEQTRKVLLRLVSEEQAQFIHFKEKKERPKNIFMERIFSGAWTDKHGKKDDENINETEDENNDDDDNYSKPEQKQKNQPDDEGLQRKHMIDTTLQVHFFGKKGKDVLHYDGFYKFMDNLQTEVLELEFNEFSKGNLCISELDFAKILLRYTYLDTDEYDVFLERLMDRVRDERGISFNEFRDFCRFLNNLDDFVIAMRMYTLADRAISKDEFSRAVKICTGYTLTPHLIDTVFAIFDEDGDGLLSYKEFIAIMKDRLHRGFKSVAKAEGWDAFKHCLKQDMQQSAHKS